MNKVIEKCLDDTTPAEMEKCVNNEDDEDKEKTENKNGGVIHRYITENEKETNRDTLEKLIEELLHYTTRSEMEKCVNNEDYNEKEKQYIIKMKV